MLEYDDDEYKKKWCEWIEKGAALKLYNKQPSQSSLLGQATTIKRIRVEYTKWVCNIYTRSICCPYSQKHKILSL